MTSTSKTTGARARHYLILVLLLIGCLWVGWHDFDLWIPQEVIRENIRWLIRNTVQIVIQYIVPLGILVFFAREITADKRSKQ